MLASSHGGPLATSRQGDTLSPTAALIHVKVQLDGAPDVLREYRGRLELRGERRSLRVEWLTQLASVFARESGF